MSTLVDKYLWRGLSATMTIMPSCKARRKSAHETRSAILEAAREKFAQNGYDQTGLREIAAAAGVDAALICRYFGSKQELLGEVLACPSKFAAILAGPKEQIGTGMAEQLFLPRDERDKSEGIAQLLVLLRAASSPQAHGLLKQSIETGFLAPLRARLTGENCAERAMLVAACLFGTAVMRFIICESAPTGNTALAGLLSDALQAAIDPVKEI